MKLSTTLKTATAAFALLAGVAHADMHATGQFGSWSTLAGTNAGNIPMCTLEQNWRNASIMFKAEMGSAGLAIHIFKSGWQIPQGQTVAVDLQVDSAPVLNLVGNGIAIPATGIGGLEIELPFNTPSPISGKTELVDLFQLLEHGVSLHLSFPNGNEPPWAASLRGASAASAAFARCLQVLDRPTQPFNGTPRQPATAPATQPF